MGPVPAKYTEPHGRIAVRVHEHGTDQLAIEISDKGAGISPELLPNIFELFMQADRILDRAQGGLGIGLSVVKKLIEMHACVWRTIRNERAYYKQLMPGLTGRIWRYDANAADQP